MVDGMDHCGIKAKLLIQQHKKKKKNHVALLILQIRLPYTGYCDEFDFC